MPANLDVAATGMISQADNNAVPPANAVVVERSASEASSFTTYRAERVSMTSALWSGGDWHWRLTAPSGAILADCGGYPSEAECLAVIEALRGNARSAHSPAANQI